jgi:hypothetical protein
LFKFDGAILDDLVKSPKSLFFVIPAKAGIQYFHRVTKNLDPVFQRGDDFFRDHQISFVKFLAQKTELNNTSEGPEILVISNLKENIVCRIIALLDQ